MANSRSLKAGDAFIRFSLSDGRIKKQLKNLQRRFTAIGAGLQKLAGIGLKVGVGIAAGMALPVKAASDLQETMGKFNTVFGANSKAIKAWGDNFAGEVGRSRGEVAGFLAGMQDLFVPLGFASTEAEGLSKQVTKLAVDLASFNNKSDADTIRDLQAALTGSGEVMKKYGVIVSEAAVKQQLLNTGIDPKKATEQQKVQARLNIIMAGTTAAQGDAVRTAGSFANQLKRAKGSIIDFAAAIGQPLLAPLAKLLEWFSDLASEGLKHSTNIARWFHEAFSSVIHAVGAGIFVFKNWNLLVQRATTSALLSVVSFSNRVVHLFSTVIPTWLVWFADNWRDIFTDIATLTGTIAGNIWNNLSNLWDAIAGLFRGEGFQFEWVGLTEGFESAIKELPRIAEREIGQLEGTLKGQLDGLTRQLDKAAADHQRDFVARAEAFEASFLGLSPSDSQESVANAAANAGAKAASAISEASSRGLFNVAGLQSLQGGVDSLAQRRTKAAEETARHTKDIKKNKLVVGA